MKVLSGREVYQLSIDHAVQHTKESAKSPSRPYYRAKYDGIGFTVDQTFLDAFNAGNVVEITLSEGERSVSDPVNPGTTKTIKSIAFNSFATKAQILNVVKFEKELAVIESPAIGNVEVTDELLAKLQKALTNG